MTNKKSILLSIIDMVNTKILIQNIPLWSTGRSQNLFSDSNWLVFLTLLGNGYMFSNPLLICK